MNIHAQHARNGVDEKRENGCVHNENYLGFFSGPEPHEKQGQKSDSRNKTEKVDERFEYEPQQLNPPDNDSGRNPNEHSKSPAGADSFGAD